MLRHLKMELKRQELELELEMKRKQKAVSSGTYNEANVKHQEQVNELKPRRARRSSAKPQMEKRRRARINQCLDALKSYVLTDSDNLSQLGVDTSDTSENHKDEEAIARTILKSSGLINRHRGRKNPNKLEKADILELTVAYVRRLHEQRDAQWNRSRQQVSLPPPPPPNSPLLLAVSLPSINSLPSPPPSSTSCSPQPLLVSICRNNIQPPPTADILDLSEKKTIFKHDRAYLVRTNPFVDRSEG